MGIEALYSSFELYEFRGLHLSIGTVRFQCDGDGTLVNTVLAIEG